MTTEELPLNYPQIRSIITNANHEVFLGGRGCGKSTLIGYKSQKLAKELPRSASVFTGRTYKQLLELTLPPVIAFWEKMGYEEEKDFVIGKKPPTRWQWQKPLQAPISYKHFISFKNGSGFYLASQDRENNFRGPSIDFVFADEGLSLMKGRFEEEVLAAKRGNRARFGHHPLHEGVHITSTKPQGKEGDWLYEYGSYYENVNERNDIRKRIKEIELEMMEKVEQPDQLHKLWQQRKSEKKKLNFYKSKGDIFYHEANCFDNLANLGLNYIRDQYRVMSELKFCIEMLNYDQGKTEQGFYGLLNESTHCYDAYDYSVIDDQDDMRNIEIDCRVDGELQDAPLHIACDYGGTFNCCVTGQYNGQHFNILKSNYRKHPDNIQTVIEDWCHYYRHHKHNIVHYHYDQTAIGKDGKSSYTYMDEVVRILHANGWLVHKHYQGKAPAQFKKYELWNMIFRRDPRFPVLFINRGNNASLLDSMNDAALKRDRDNYKKDKSSEDIRKGIPQEKATHLSDAADQLVWGLFASCLNDNPAFADTVSA